MAWFLIDSRYGPPPFLFLHPPLESQENYTIASAMDGPKEKRMPTNSVISTPRDV